MKEFAETTINELLGWYGYNNAKEINNKNTESRQLEVPLRAEECRWCGKSLDDKLAIKCTSFCSDVCFSEYMHNEERKKICNWCQQVVGTETFSDNEDNDTPLSFCSEDCLNQYKMHVFCQETQAHLEMYPHMSTDENSNEPLITPDLWIKNNKKHSTSSLDQKPECNGNKTLFKIEDKIANNATRKLNYGRKRKLKRPIVVECNDNLPQDLRVSKRTATENKTDTLIDSDKPNIPIPLPENNENVKTQSILENTLNNKQPLKTPLHNFSAWSNSSHLNLLSPSTLMVPYPIILPLPIPIPIPIPISLKPEEKKKIEFRDNSCQTSNKIKCLEEIKSKPVRSLRIRRQLFNLKSKARCKKTLVDNN